MCWAQCCRHLCTRTVCWTHRRVRSVPEKCAGHTATCDVTSGLHLEAVAGHGGQARVATVHVHIRPQASVLGTVSQTCLQQEGVLDTPSRPVCTRKVCWTHRHVRVVPGSGSGRRRPGARRRCSCTRSRPSRRTTPSDQRAAVNDSKIDLTIKVARLKTLETSAQIFQAWKGLTRSSLRSARRHISTQSKTGGSSGERTNGERTIKRLRAPRPPQ